MKAKSYKTQMYGDGESSGGIVPAKRSKEGLGGLQEIVEGRLPAKENSNQSIPAPDSEPDEWANHGWGRVRRSVTGPRHYPRWEPCALGAPARFCAGGAGQPASQPRR